MCLGKSLINCFPQILHVYFLFGAAVEDDVVDVEDDGGVADDDGCCMAIVD